jgi:uncharacterized protein (DUF927 family)
MGRMADCTALEKVYTEKEFADAIHEICEAIYKLKDDQFEHDLAVEKMAAAGRKAGFPYFKKHYNNYYKKISSMSGSNMGITHYSDFEGQDLVLETGEWKADDTGVYKQKGDTEIVACVHPILPKERYVDVDSGVEKLKIEYSPDGIGWRSMICEKKDISTANKIVDALSNYGVAVTSETARDLVKYLHDVESLNRSKIPEKKSIGRLGWTENNGFSPYNDELVFDGDLTYKYLYESVVATGDYKVWKDEILKLRASESIPARIALASAFASVLVAPLNFLPFISHFWGDSGTGKTVMIMVAASVWADPEMGKYVSTFNSTDVALEVRCGFLNSLPMIMDELQMLKSNRWESADKMIYKLTQGAGKSRGQKQGGLQRLISWRNCIITTGEQPITEDSSGGGAINRVIDVNCENTKIFESPKELLSVIRTNYGHAGKMFVEKLKLMDTEEVRDIYNKLADEIAQHTTSKQAGAAALILTADILIDMFLFEDGKALTVKEILPHLASTKEVDQNERAFEWLSNWIVQNRGKLNGKSDGNVEVLGKVSGNRIYVLSSVFRKASLDAGHPPAPFLNWLRRNELIDCDDGAFSRPVKIDGETSRCVCLIKDVFQKRQGEFVEIPEDEVEPFTK